MAFQDDCGTIILDAVLTDIGRQRMARNTFEIDKFALGDDEVDYSLGNSSTGTWRLSSDPPILEAFGNSLANIQHGLMSLSERRDILYIPQFFYNELVTSSCKQYNTRYYISANDETTTKLKSVMGEEYILENNIASHNFIFIESGISEQSLSDTPAGKERFITNLSLHDEYLFIYGDSRVIDRILINPSDAFFRNDSNDNLYLNVSPLREAVKISFPAPIENYETFKMKTIDNQIFADKNGTQTNSSINGPRGIAAAFNLKLNDRLNNDSNSERDERYTTFGLTDQLLFGGSDKYDYIDTVVMIEGTSTGMKKNIPIRIIRYAGT